MRSFAASEKKEFPHIERKNVELAGFNIYDNRLASREQKHIQENAEQGPVTQLQKKMFEGALPNGTRNARTSPLPHPLKNGLEYLSGLDLSGVKVHFNSNQPGQVDALAYAQGDNIHLGPGQEEHLPHEAWHVVQQKRRQVLPNDVVNGRAVNNSTALEREADVMGEKALNIEHVHDQHSGITSLYSGSTTASVVQRKIGYEVELNTPMYARDVVDSEFPVQIPGSNRLKSFIRCNENLQPKKGVLDEHMGLNVQYEFWNREQEFLQKLRDFQAACIASGIWVPTQEERGPLMRPEIVTDPIKIGLDGNLVDEAILNWMQFLVNFIFKHQYKQGPFLAHCLGLPAEELRLLRTYACDNDLADLEQSTTNLLAHQFDLNQYAHLQASMGFDMESVPKMQDALLTADEASPDQSPKTRQLMSFYRNSAKLIRGIVDLAMTRLPEEPFEDSEQKSNLRAYLILCCESVIGFTGLSLIGALNSQFGNDVNLMPKDAFALLPRNSALALYKELPGGLQVDSRRKWQPMVNVLKVGTAISIRKMLLAIKSTDDSIELNIDEEVNRNVESLRQMVCGEASDFENLDPEQMTKLNKMDKSKWRTKMPVFEFRRILGRLTFTTPSGVKDRAKTILREITKTLEPIFIADK